MPILGILFFLKIPYKSIDYTARDKIDPWQ
jgi:hypothetical protein